MNQKLKHSIIGFPWQAEEISWACDLGLVCLCSMLFIGFPWLLRVTGFGGSVISVFSSNIALTLGG